MNMEFTRKLTIPAEVKRMYPLTPEMEKCFLQRDHVIKGILNGDDDRLLLLIGPCSADRIDSVLDYMHRLRELQEKVKDRIYIVPRCYTNKPRTTGLGYMGMLHQPNPHKEEDMLAGIIAIREMHTRVARETGFTCAEEMLYPENHRYLSDLLSYVAVGARSVEDQLHRIVASGIGIPAGMKNPTGGDISVMMNSITAAQSPQKFVYRGWEVRTKGNLLAHAILRGYVDKFNHSMPNYHYEDLRGLLDLYEETGLANPAVIVDCNHSNSGKQYLEQIRIAKDVMYSCHVNQDIRSMVKGLMIESYLLDGCQKPEDSEYGLSITDPCLGWEKSEALVLELAESVEM